jgi:hypothetical protein
MKFREKPHTDKYNRITNDSNYVTGCTPISPLRHLRFVTCNISAAWLLLHRVYIPVTNLRNRQILVQCSMVRRDCCYSCSDSLVGGPSHEFIQHRQCFSRTPTWRNQVVLDRDFVQTCNLRRLSRTFWIVVLDTPSSKLCRPIICLGSLDMTVWCIPHSVTMFVVFCWFLLLNTSRFFKLSKPLCNWLINMYVENYIERSQFLEFCIPQHALSFVLNWCNFAD